MRLPFFSTSSSAQDPTSAVKDKKKKKIKDKKTKSKDKATELGTLSCSPNTVLSMEAQGWGTPSSSAASTPSSFSSTISSSAACDQSVSSKSSLSVPARGGITKDDLALVVRRLDENVDTITPEVDVDAGALSEEDLKMLLAQMPAEEELLTTFRVFDADGDGKITAEELRGALAMLGDEGCSVEDCRGMIGEVDSVGDGVVCFPDFARMMLNTVDVK